MYNWKYLWRTQHTLRTWHNESNVLIPTPPRSSPSKMRGRYRALIQKNAKTPNLLRHTLRKNTPSLNGCAFSIRLHDCGEFCGGANLGERQLSHFPSSSTGSEKGKETYWPFIWSSTLLTTSNALLHWATSMQSTNTIEIRHGHWDGSRNVGHCVTWSHWFFTGSTTPFVVQSIASRADVSMNFQVLQATPHIIGLFPGTPGRELTS